MFNCYATDTVTWVKAPTVDQYGAITAPGARVSLRLRVKWGTRLVRNMHGEQVASAASLHMAEMPTHLDTFEISGVTHAVLAIHENADFTVRDYRVYLS
jgi:hypothetical protein